MVEKSVNTTISGKCNAFDKLWNLGSCWKAKREGTRLIYLLECKVECLHRGPFCGSHCTHYIHVVVVGKTWAYFRAIFRLAMQQAAAVWRSIMRLCEDINSKLDRENGPNWNWSTAAFSSTYIYVDDIHSLIDAQHAPRIAYLKDTWLPRQRHYDN